MRLSTSAFKLFASKLSIAVPHRGANGTLVVGFLLALMVPMVGSGIGQVATQGAENREPAPPPKWKSPRFRKEFDAYYADRVGGRAQLLPLRNRVLLEAFEESASSSVIIGRDGWLYLNTGLDTLQPNGYESRDCETIAAVLTERAAWCRERGIVYVVQIAREKHMIHPEALPARAKARAIADGVPLLQGLCPEVAILDTLLVLKAETGFVYYAKDTHWNPTGALAAYRQLAEHLERVQPGYCGKPRIAFTAIPTHHPIGDLARMAGLPADQQGEDDIWQHPPVESIRDHSTTELEAARSLRHIPPQVRSSAKTNGLRLLLLHDSFGIAFRDYLAGDVERFTALGTYDFPFEAIEDMKPQIIVQQFVDRVLYRNVPRPKRP